MGLFYQEIRKDFRVNPVQGGLFETALQLVHRMIQKYKEIMLLSRKRLFFEMMKVNVTIFGKYAKILEDKKRSLLAKPESPDITACTILNLLLSTYNYKVF